jgi:hypothetical protein
MATLNVVFVHGLNPLNIEDHPYRAWTHKNGTCWPRDLFPKTCPKARVLLFGYNASVAIGLSKLAVHDHANGLLDRLLQNRKSDRERRRPLVFIAHSLGGLVVKQALIDAALDPAMRPNLKEATLGIVFFATPHRGGNGVPLGHAITNAVLRLSGESASRNDILENLDPMSAQLKTLTQNFRPMLEHFHFVSFFETKPTHPKNIGPVGRVFFKGKARPRPV